MKKGQLNLDIPGSIIALRAIVSKFFYQKDYFDYIFQTKGLEFEGYREYSLNDDAWAIDWKASKRANTLLVRQYKKERDLKIAFIIDSGDGMIFGSQKKLKCEYAAELSAAIASLIIDTNNFVGFVFFSDEIKEYVPFKKGKKQLYLFSDMLKDGNNYGGPTNMELAIDFAMNYFDRDTHSIFFVSDFLNVNPKLTKKMAFLASKYDTIAIKVTDPLDKTLPKIEEEFIIENPKTGEQLLVNPAVARRAYERFALVKDKKIKEFFRKTGIDYLELDTSKPFAVPVSVFLKKRMFNNL